MQATAQNNWYLDKWFIDDDNFHKLYPIRIQKLAGKHWTPLKVGKCAADFLVVEEGARVLDIGSGAGKFCLAAGHFKPAGLFYGIEQREGLVDIAVETSHKLDLHNVTFLEGNFTQLDFTQFDHFYFYNSFYENLEGTEKIDHSIQYSLSLYNYYNSYLYNQLEKMPLGTRVATYESLGDEMPPDYYIVKTQFDKSLKFWIKA